MSILRDELTNDPSGMGYADMTAEEVESAINAQDISVRVNVDVTELNRHLLETGLWETLNQTADETDGSGDPTDAARAADILLAASVAPPSTVDLDSVGLSGALDRLESAGAITATERSDIDALADDTISRAGQIGLSRVRVGDIQRARR